MVRKQLVCPERARRIPQQFSWVDQELVRGGYAKRVSAEALGLYLFLITVGDSAGLSYYSDRSIGEQLSLDKSRLDAVRGELLRVSLIAYKPPLYQVLSLEPQPPPLRRSGGSPQAIADVLRSIGSAK